VRCSWVFELREWVGDCTIEDDVYGIQALNSSVHGERCYSSYLPHPLQLEYTSYSIMVLSLPPLLPHIIQTQWLPTAPPATTAGTHGQELSSARISLPPTIQPLL